VTRGVESCSVDFLFRWRLGLGLGWFLMGIIGVRFGGWAFEDICACSITRSVWTFWMVVNVRLLVT